MSSGSTKQSRSDCQQSFFECTLSIMLVSVSNVCQEAALYTMWQVTGLMRKSMRIGDATIVEGNSM